MFVWKCIIFSLMMIVLATASASAQPYQESFRTKAYGGSGGLGFHQICGRNEVLVGLNVTLGDDMNSVSAVCQLMQDDHSVDQFRDIGTVGDAHDKSGAARCRGGLVEGMWVATSNAHVVHHIELVCRMSDGSRRKGKVLNDGAVIHGGDTAATKLADCGPDSYAIGIFGRYGSLIDRLGLVCGEE